jgi:hypothetical protein
MIEYVLNFSIIYLLMHNIKKLVIKLVFNFVVQKILIGWIGACLNLNCLTKCLIKTALRTVMLHDIYSAVIVDFAMLFCFLHNQ